MLSVILLEHEEQEHVIPMLDQVESAIPYPKEVIIVTSGASLSIPKKYDFRIRIITNVLGTGEARNIGAINAYGDILVYSDLHCCLPDNLGTMFEVLEHNPRSVVVPGIQPFDFPACVPTSSGVGGGLYYDIGIGLHWLGKPTDNMPTPIPTQMTTFLMMRKQTFNASIWGFIECGGIGFDEEIEIRLCRFGYPTLLVPDVIVSHYFAQRPRVPEEMPHFPQAIALVLNVFDNDLYSEIDKTCFLRRGGEQWKNALAVAMDRYRERREWIRKQGSLDENWFFRREG